MRGGEACEFAISSGQDNYIGGGLFEVYGFCRAIDHAGCGGEEVHQPSRALEIAV